MYWKEILQVYEDMGVEDIIPIAHTRVKPNIKVLLDESGNFVGARLNRSRERAVARHIQYMTTCNIYVASTTTQSAKKSTKVT